MPASQLAREIFANLERSNNINKMIEAQANYSRFRVDEGMDNPEITDGSEMSKEREDGAPKHQDCKSKFAKGYIKWCGLVKMTRRRRAPIRTKRLRKNLSN